MVRWLDISRIVRNNKRTLDTQIPSPIRVPRVKNTDKVIETLEYSKCPLTFTEILSTTKIKSSGNLHNVLRNLINDNRISRNSDLYNLI